jgi:hypothetical protein
MILDADPRRHLAAEAPLLLFARFRQLRRIVHAAGFDRGAALQAFQAGDLLALFANRLLQPGDFIEQLNQQSLKLWTVQIRKSG